MIWNHPFRPISSFTGFFGFAWLAVVTAMVVMGIGPAAVTVVHAEDLRASADCTIDAYYQSVQPVTEASPEVLQILLESTHAQKLPYTDTDADDVWKALQDLDRGSSTTTGGQPTVKLIYSNREVPSEPKGTGDTWNREHVWPKSHGVGYNGHDYTDVHHLFPADWGINSIRNNRYFDACRPEDGGACKIPSELAGTDDAPLYGGDNIFQPPSTVRGDVARALFYMALRYPHLELTDCPQDIPEGEDGFQMAYLSTLLEWHTLDPPTDQERERNDRVCSRWQGNRNPFVDFPELAEILYGAPLSTSDRQAYCQSQNSSENNGNESDAAVEDATETLPDAAASIALPSPGDVMVVGVHSDNPDTVALVTLVDLPKGLVIHLTDNAYDGTAFASNEGTMSLALAEALPAGSLFGYGEGLNLGDAWTNEFDRGFSLSSSGDTVVVYATRPGEEEDPDTMAFLSAVSFAGGAFLEACPAASEGGQAACGTDASVLPPSIRDYVVRLEKRDNYVYDGPTTGTLAALQSQLADESQHWKGSDAKTEIALVPDSETDGFVIASERGMPSSGGSRW